MANAPGGPDDERRPPRSPADPSTRQVPVIGPVGAMRVAGAAGAARSLPRAPAAGGAPPPDPWSTKASEPGAGGAGGEPAAGPGGSEPPAGGGERHRLRHRLFPRSLLGITAFILALSLGAAFSGVVLYSYYQYRLDQTNSRVNALINGYRQQFKNAEGQLNAQANQARSEIQSQLEPLRQLEAQAATLGSLAKKLGPSVYFVHTLDAAGQPSVGSAFVVASTASQSLLLTSYTTVKAATTNPGPPVYVQQGNTSTPVTVRSWDPTYDLALIVLASGHLPVVSPATTSPSLGERVFALSGLGSGASISQGAITEVSANGIEHNTPISAAFQGGPLVDASGQVLGVASRTYAPLGFASDGVWFAPYVNAACQKVLTCPGGTISSSH